jgi:hypothetical protein
MVFPRSAAMVVLVALALGCGSPTGPEAERDRDLAALAAARRQWQAQGLTSYDIHYQNLCFCTAEVRARVRLEVRGGLIAGVVQLDNGLRLEATTFPRYRTVEGLFQLIAQALAEDADDVEVRYDASRGQPLEVFIDRSERIADEEIRVETGDLVPR